MSFEITDRLSAPYRSICYITCTWADGTQTRASGVIVGINDVLTANHVVYDAFRGGYATSISVMPAADTVPALVTPFGAFTDVGVINTRTPNWDPNGDQLLSAAESQYDLAVIGMKSAIGNITGWLATSPAASDFTGTMTGYPARGTGMMSEAVFADASGSAGVFDINAVLGAGASGGPLIQTDATGTYVTGVLSSGSATRSTYAGLFGPGNWDWLNSVMAANDSVMVNTAVNLVGTSGADTMAGSSFNDTFRGAGGNDVINGGAGTDTASFTGTRAGYRLFNTGSSVTVTDNQAGRDGIDSVTSVERLIFTDMTINLEIGAKSLTVSAAQLKTLEELYVAFFNRVPDADGLAFWIDQTAAGQPLGSIADSFYNAALLYPSLTGYASGMSNSAFVNVIYRNVLGRADGGDAEGVAFWSNALAAGTQTRGNLVTTMLGSAHTFKGSATFGYVADLLDNKALVAQRFAVELGINYNTPELSISNGMAIAAAVTPSSTAAAISLIGITDNFSTIS